MESLPETATFPPEAARDAAAAGDLSPAISSESLSHSILKSCDSKSRGRVAECTIGRVDRREPLRRPLGGKSADQLEIALADLGLARVFRQSQNFKVFVHRGSPFLGLLFRFGLRARNRSRRGLKIVVNDRRQSRRHRRIRMDRSRPREIRTDHRRKASRRRELSSLIIVSALLIVRQERGLRGNARCLGQLQCLFQMHCSPRDS